MSTGVRRQRRSDYGRGQSQRYVYQRLVCRISSVQVLGLLCHGGRSGVAAPPPAPAADQIGAIRAARSQRLNSPMGQNGPESTVGCAGSMSTGYSAQCEAAIDGPRDCGPEADVLASGQAASFTTSKIRVRPRMANPGFLVLRRGRAVCIVVLSAASPAAMAGQGTGPQPPPRHPPQAAKVEE